MRNILNYYADTDSHWILYFHISIVMQGGTKKYFPCILSQEWKQKKITLYSTPNRVKTNDFWRPLSNGYLEETSKVPTIVLNLTSASIYGLQAHVGNVSRYPYA